MRDDGAQPSGRGNRRRVAAPEVLPGVYTVRIRKDGVERTRSLTVRPDPRIDIPMEERVARHQAVTEATRLTNSTQ